MSEKLKIYVCCHKDYDYKEITNPVYKLISDKDIKNDSSLELIKSDGYLDNRMWSELSHMYYVWKHEDLPDYVGFCHYRRFFDFMNDIPEMDDKIIIPKPILNKYNNYISYDICHYSKDLLNCLIVISKDFKDYAMAMDTMISSHMYFPYNMFILPKKIFIEYCEFIFGVLFKIDHDVLHIDNMYENMLKRIGNKREHYIEKSMNPNNLYSYQARLYGFLAERLTTAFFMKYKVEHEKDSVKEINVKITEHTYNRI